MPRLRIQSPHLYKTIFLQSPISTQIFSFSGETIQVNKAWEKLWGVTLKEIEPYNILRDKQLVKKGIMPYIKKGFAGTATRIPAIKYEPAKTIKHARAIPYRWVEAVIYPVKDPSGNVTEVILQHEDITQQKETQERQIFLDRLSSLLSTSLDVEETLKKIRKLIIPYLADYCRIVVVDEKKQIRDIAIQHVNPTKSPLVKTLYDTYKDIPNITHGIPYILRSGKVDLMTKVTQGEIIKAKGSKPLKQIVSILGLKSYIGVPLKARGRIIGAITFSSTHEDRLFTKADVPFIKEIALRIAFALDNAGLYQQALFELKKRKEAAQKLKQSEQRYRLVFESANDLITVLDVNGNYLYTSPSHTRIMGYTSKELHATDAFSRIHPDDLPLVKKEFLLALKGEIRSATYRIQHKNGRWLMIESTGSAILDEHGKPYMVVITSHDVTERVELERRKDEFLSLASHELKTPVTSLKAYAQVLQRRFMKQGDTLSAFHLAKMDTQLNKLTNLIADLLDISKIQAGKLQFSLGAFSIDMLVREITEELQHTTDDHKIIIIGRAEKYIHADRERTGQVLINLLSNAIKYSPDADRIYIHITTDDKVAIISVQDFGVGVPADKQEHIFERFYRVNGPKESTFPGLGLGLYISSEIIKTQGGRIWVKSTKGKGTTVSFTIPLAYINT